jgi:hypothetical protein
MTPHPAEIDGGTMHRNDAGDRAPRSRRETAHSDSQILFASQILLASVTS